MSVCLYLLITYSPGLSLAAVAGEKVGGEVGEGCFAHTRSSPIGPALHEDGGSRPRSVSSLLMRLSAMAVSRCGCVLWLCGCGCGGERVCLKDEVGLCRSGRWMCDEGCVEEAKRHLGPAAANLNKRPLFKDT